MSYTIKPVPTEPQMQVLKNLIDGKDLWAHKDQTTRNWFGSAHKTAAIMINRGWLTDEYEITNKGRKVYEKRLIDQQIYQEKNHE